MTYSEVNKSVIEVMTFSSHVYSPIYVYAFELVVKYILPCQHHARA
jgi:hypothetical protein